MQTPPPPSLIEALEKASHILLLSHLRPDGDAYGSTLGLGLALQAFGKKVTLCNEDGLNSLYTFMPESHLIQRSPAQCPECDLMLALDTSTSERLGKTWQSWNREVDWNIDHHVSNTGYGRQQWIDPGQPATACLITDLISTAGWPLTSDAAAALFVGVSTDTGSFRYRGTSSHTFRQAALLADHGADTAALAKECYQSISLPRFRLHQQVLATLQLELHSSLSWIQSTPEIMSACGAQPEDTEGLVEKALTIREVQVSAFFEHRPQGSLKVSLRSKGLYNVNQIADKFGGGGHPGAAGINFPSDGPGNQVRVLDSLRSLLQQNPPS